MERKIDWSSLGFGYMKTDYRYVSYFMNGSWDEGSIISDENVVINESACVLQYAQTCFEGLKAYRTKDGNVVCFRPDLNAERMYNSALRLEMPPFPKDRFIDAVKKVVNANLDYVPPYGSGASLYIRPYMFGINPVIGVKPAEIYKYCYESNTKEHIQFFMDQLRTLDYSDRNCQKRLIDIFVNSIYITDDELTIACNYTGDNSQLTFPEFKEILASSGFVRCALCSTM